MEGRRWSDIHRLQGDDLFPIDGIPTKVAYGAALDKEMYELGTAFDGPYDVQAIPSSDFRFLWPFPQVEINANPTLSQKQNPGW